MYLVEVKIKRVSAGAQIPTKATEGSAFYDVYACEGVSLGRGLVTMVPTGLYFEVPLGYELEIRPRSGLSLRTILLANSPGTLDSDYRGELKILLLNLGDKDYQVKKGDRVAQIGVRAAPVIEFVEGELSTTKRGQGGFGSTGK